MQSCHDLFHLRNAASPQTPPAWRPKGHWQLPFIPATVPISPGFHSSPPPPPLNEYQKRKFQQDGGRGAGHLTGPKAELGGGRKEHISVIQEALPAQLWVMGSAAGTGRR